ncbi:MAG: hypothetical protein ACRDL6_04160 [Solirubrobacterales bacterium]
MARRRVLVCVGVGLAALVVAGCGRDDFENEPRPPVPAEVNVKIGDGEVVVSPREFGAGLVNFTIANFYTEPTVLEISGPTEVSSKEVPPGGNTILKAEMTSGEYEASADDVKAFPFNFEVGPERESGQDDLLLP